MTSQRITFAKGDGIGPEIMDATLKILEAAKCGLQFDEIEVGEKVYLSGHSSGIAEESWQTLLRNKILLKSPITTPQGGGYKSLNVTIRKTLGLFANIRPCRGYSPFVETLHPKMDLVIVRENEEDLYAGIEHRQTNEVYQCLKLVSRPGCERIIRYAFEFTKAAGRKKLTCLSKDNIMKMTDGIFHQVFDDVGKLYPEIEKNHLIIDIGAARLADTPEDFDVIVTGNLYGDIISDITAQISGSVGLGGSSNIGESCAMFEAIHGSAPDIAGKNIANPSGLIQGAVLMLIHLGKTHEAALIHNAWMKTLEDGIHTGDIFHDSHSKKRAGTAEFSEALISRLGEKPKQLKAVEFDGGRGVDMSKIRYSIPKEKKELEGIDIFVDEDDRNATKLANKLVAAQKETDLELLMITNRGVKVWPDGRPETFCTDHWRCRFYFKEGKRPRMEALLDLYASLQKEGVDVIKTENLYLFDGKKGYSLGQGQ
jgi:isocitrate dehydrogenase